MNNRICDPRLLEIFETRACPELPAELSERAYAATRRLLAARDWRDILTKVAPLPGDRFAIHVHGKWVIGFVWIAGQGARDLNLQRV